LASASSLVLLAKERAVSLKRGLEESNEIDEARTFLNFNDGAFTALSKVAVPATQLPIQRAQVTVPSHLPRLAKTSAGAPVHARSLTTDFLVD
jgi:hypothetical protein